MSSQAPASDAASTSFTIVAGDPTPAEVAAVTAVLGAALEELAGENERDAASGLTAWQRSQRAIRAPIVRGHDGWRGFSA
ncbi:hypothetical protein GCM10027413_08640 [Conyzicola nivalis]|uniref:Acyl-CoA carboxylase subunit epsilon n=1 Tax=Conyzicola nivalis TaxID=1477021 RepID=A0A916SJC8_9MICO|nr:acyl-CoA carboxylase subunit epsilon [Conyzicola nivalis]GGB03721.1 hypothetical protein GCM10010979_17990 [Conyzicola nivalis]